MQNNYEPVLWKKTFQEEVAREVVQAQRRGLHWPSFSFGVVFAVLMTNLMW
ncbi:hypothetical protein JCM19239_3142 [Vibrio variabilis]|uniref:Uncharacterized protein n=1 Tax=Vibrio variabilis TaxID=990271 RepID=A0ABQ0JR64_9VIBR|nr:hypothetical protein JCM19239_3142 [Vibrio variabilis]